MVSITFAIYYLLRGHLHPILIAFIITLFITISECIGPYIIRPIFPRAFYNKDQEDIKWFTERKYTICNERVALVPTLPYFGILI